ncbi:MAG: hypothetical protein ABFS24_05820 [Pseudomonadota bacterium]
MINVQTPSGTPCTGKKIFWLAALAVLSVSFTVHGASQEDGKDGSGEELEKQYTDYRTFVEIPDKARQILQEDMLDHLAVLNEINRYLAENNLRSAAEVAETGMGRSLLSKYQDEDMRPGRYMPKEMRKIGWELHNAATQFAKTARQGDLQKTLIAYHRITSTCVACHYSYRTR